MLESWHRPVHVMQVECLAFGRRGYLAVHLKVDTKTHSRHLPTTNAHHILATQIEENRVVTGEKLAEELPLSAT